MARGWLLVGMLICLFALSFPTCVVAEPGHDNEKTEPKHVAADNAHGKGGHGEEPDNFFKGVVDLSIWTVVVFLVLLFILNRFAWPLMREGLDKREQAVALALVNAQQARTEAELTRAELDRKMKHAADEIRGLLDEARRNAQQTTDEMLNKARAEIQLDRDRLRHEIQNAQDQALNEIWSQAGHLATLISTKALRRQTSEDDHRRLVDEALAEFRGAASERRQSLEGLS